MSALVTTWFGVTAAPASARVPSAGRVTIRTLASVSLAFVSAKTNSDAVKVIRRVPGRQNRVVGGGRRDR